MDKEELLALAEKISAAPRGDNYLDVLAEIALFKADETFNAVRANNAGTKVIYTTVEGGDVTCWAYDWTMTGAGRKATADDIRAIANT